MASTQFIDGLTPLQAAWFNDVNSVIYSLLSNNGQIPTSAAQIRQNLGLSGMAAQSASSIAVTGGKIDGVLIGSSKPSSGVFTDLTVNNNLALKTPIIQDFAGLTRRVTPTGGSFVREYADMTVKNVAVAVAQTIAGVTLSFSSTQGIYPGYIVSGTGIAAGTTVVSTTSTAVTLSQATTLAVLLNTTITFEPAIGSVEVGTFYNYDIFTNARDQNDIVFGSFFSDVGGIFSFVRAPAGVSGSTVAYNAWLFPFQLDLNTGNLKLTGTLDQSFGGLIRILTNAGGARIREYADIAPAGGLLTTGNVEIGTFYNASLDIAQGTWLGRDIQDVCWVEKFSDSAPYTKTTFYAPSAAAGTLPSFVRTYYRELDTGSIMLGILTSTSTATPVYLDLGGTFSNAAGQHLKVKLFNDGTNLYGFGVSSLQLDHVANAGAGSKHAFWTNATLVATISDTVGLLIKAGTTTFAPLQLTPGAKLTAAVAGAFEFDGVDLYFTPNTTISRRKLLSQSDVYNNIATAGAGTLTAAALTAGVLYRSGPTAIFTDTTDTAANIILFTGAEVGASFEFTYVNSVAFAAKIAAGAGVTLAGNTPTAVGASAVKKYLIVVTSATTVTIYGI